MSNDPYDPDAIAADPTAHPKHRAYALINIGVRDRGEVWSKCANCGHPYMHTEQWSHFTVCSEQCFREFADSVAVGGW